MGEAPQVRPGTPIDTESADYYDRSIFAKAGHRDFPEPGRQCLEYVSFPKDLSQAVDIDALFLSVKERMGLAGADEGELKNALKEYGVSLGMTQPDELQAAISYALRYGLPLSYHKAVLKGLAYMDELNIRSEGGSVRYIGAGQTFLFPVSPSEHNRLTTTIGLEGEWFVTRVRGIIFHRSIGATTLVAATTGLPTQPSSISAVTWTTEFSAVTGTVPVNIIFKGNVPVTQGEYILIRGELDRAIRGIRAVALVRGALGEMWSFNHG